MNVNDLIDCLNANYGLKVETLTLLPMGADINASVYKLKTRDKKSYFIKLKQNHDSDSVVKLLAFLQASGIEQIIPPIKTIDDKLSLSINDSSLTVYPFVDGNNGFCQNLTDKQWVILGKTFKQIHTLIVPKDLENQIKKETYSTKWQEYVRSLDSYLDSDLIGDEVTMMLQTFMKEQRKIIHRLVDSAEALSKKLQEQSLEFVLCHSDIHGGNVLIDENEELYIVDWDAPIMAPKERDLMFIGGGVANIWNNPEEESYFYQGYGKTDINQLALKYYRHERIIEDIAEYAQMLLFSSDGGESRLEMLEQFKDMFKPNGVVDIAFRTDIPK